MSRRDKGFGEEREWWPVVYYAGLTLLVAAPLIGKAAEAFVSWRIDVHKYRIEESS